MSCSAEIKPVYNLLPKLHNNKIIKTNKIYITKGLFRLLV